MKRLVLLASISVLLAACGGNRHVVSNPPYMPPPPPPPSRPVPPPPAIHRVEVPEHVASAGPLKTAMTSAYMDNQERDMRQGLRRYGVIIARRGDTMVLNMTNNIVFDGMRLSDNGDNLLATLAILLRRYDHSAINVSGFTDTSGAPDQNLAVSQKRAQIIAGTLAHDGVAQVRLSAQGYGENSLRIRTGDNIDEPRNRRIEIRITPTPVG